MERKGAFCIWIEKCRMEKRTIALGGTKKGGENKRLDCDIGEYVMEGSEGMYMSHIDFVFRVYSSEWA